MKRAGVKVAVALAALAALAGAGALAWSHYPWMFHPHYNLKVATGPLASDGQKLVATFLREVSSEYPLVRLQPVATDSVEASGKALAEGRVDLAVVRSDDAAAASGRTVFILRRIGVALLLPPGSGIESPKDLVGRKIALVEPANPSDPLLKAVTGFYGIDTQNLIPVRPAELSAVLKERRAAAAMVLGPVGPGPIADAFASLRKSYKAKPTFLDMAEAEAIASRDPVFESLEIKPGSFGGAPPEPPEEIHTVALSIRLVARPSLPNRVAGEVTRLLIASRAKLLSTTPAAGQMEVPATDLSASLPVHAGTLAYLNGEQQSLLDETMNYYWAGVMVLGVLGPLGAFLAGRVRGIKADPVRPKLLRLIELTGVARTGQGQDLEDADAELEALLEWAFDAMLQGQLDRDQFQCVERMIAQVRRSIEKRKSRLPLAASPVADGA